MPVATMPAAPPAKPAIIRRDPTATIREIALRTPFAVSRGAIELHDIVRLGRELEERLDAWLRQHDPESCACVFCRSEHFTPEDKRQMVGRWAAGSWNLNTLLSMIEGELVTLSPQELELAREISAQETNDIPLPPPIDITGGRSSEDHVRRGRNRSRRRDVA